MLQYFIPGECKSLKGIKALTPFRTGKLRWTGRREMMARHPRVKMKSFRRMTLIDRYSNCGFERKKILVILNGGFTQTHHDHGYYMRLAKTATVLCVTTFRPGHGFPDNIFECIFLCINCCTFLQISLKFVCNGPIDNISALDWIMAESQRGERALSEPMDPIHWRIHVFPSLIVFKGRIDRWPVNSPHKWPATRIFFRLMTSSSKGLT